jgi:hypothetical protein
MRDRRDVLRGGLAAGGLIGLGACAAPNARIGSTGAAKMGSLPLPPMRASIDRIYDIKCCIRPFRAAGPRLDAEMIGDALVVHNYGHGGSGWSLSWGSAQIAVEKATAALPDRIAVIGCGVIGLTTAIAAQRAGAQVTIYAKDVFQRTRSVRANGSWTPDSRVSLAAPAGPGFATLWERMARTSWKSFRSYVGLPGRPVDFADQYHLSDEPFEGPEKPDPAITGSYATAGLPQQNSEFGKYSDSIRDLAYVREDYAEGATPFPAKHVRRNTLMFFNFSSYGEVLMQQFHQMGGRIVIREFRSPAEYAVLPEKVVINCPGYAARDLMRDNSIIPVRGQTVWLIPQTEVEYGVTYGGSSALSKSDGLLIMGGPGMRGGEMANVGNSDELVDRADAEAAVAPIAQLFARYPRAAQA